MVRRQLAALAAAWAIGLGNDSLLADEPARPKPLTAVPFQNVHIHDAFWSPRIETNRKATIEANLHQCEITGRIKNFAVAGKLIEGKHEGALYNDSDVYKMIEGIAYALSSKRDPELEKRADAIIDQIAAAQQPDGYLNTYYTLVKPQERWKNIAHGHELYCAGHLIEAAVAYHHATGKRKLLDVAIKFADHIDSVFGPGKKFDCCGHEEIELALVKLYRATNEKRYLELAKFFLDVRGHVGPASGAGPVPVRGHVGPASGAGPVPLGSRDLQKRGHTTRKSFGDYAQDHKPIREQTEVVGHAVRAMYLYAAMADVAALTGDQGLWKAIEKIWDDVVHRKMYITGGIGPSAHNEGFTVPYDLPNDTAYAETCAAIGMALWNHRMFLMTGDAKYADVLEREVYNGLLSGVSLSGDRFFYTNPLGSKGKVERVPWFDCSCCPTNIVRYIPAMGERVYAHRDNEIYTVLYMGCTATIQLKDGKVKLTQETRYPWSENVTITVEPEKEFDFSVLLRVPSFDERGGSLRVEVERVIGEDLKFPQPKVTVAGKGFVRVTCPWAKGDKIQLTMPTLLRRVHADPKVKTNTGRVALMRGPLVYCLEGADNNGRVRNLMLPKDSRTYHNTIEEGPLKGMVSLWADGSAVRRGKDGQLETGKEVLRLVPYFAWANRGPGQMVVWIPEKPELAEIPGEEGVLSNGVRVNASHCFANDKLEALNDGALPKSSNDHGIPRMTWWDKKGTTEWVSYQFPEPREVSKVSVYWFDDAPRGGCRTPAEWRLLYRDGKEWKPVKLAGGSSYGTDLNQFNEIAFEPVKTKELKLEVKLRPGFSGGILEWQHDGSVK